MQKKNWAKKLIWDELSKVMQCNTNTHFIQINVRHAGCLAIPKYVILQLHGELKNERERRTDVLCTLFLPLTCFYKWQMGMAESDQPSWRSKMNLEYRLWELPTTQLMFHQVNRAGKGLLLKIHQFVHQKKQSWNDWTKRRKKFDFNSIHTELAKA